MEAAESGLTPLDPRYVTLQREIGRYVALVASIGTLAGMVPLLGWRYWYGGPLLAATVAALLLWFAQRWPPVVYRHTSYRVDDEGIEIRMGVLWRSIASVARSRVQHTDVSQGPLERKHGLGRLVIYTAGTAHSRVELPGLAHHTAIDLRNHLLPRHDHGPDVV